ncbi:UDP-3-O-(3-hydroxymyristoyl)glucosamine N-acyltransferase [Thermodesulfobacteriota bacterium]
MKHLSELAELVQGEIVGQTDLMISAFSELDSAQAGEISFIVNPRMVERIATTRASAVIVPPGVVFPEKTLLRVKNPVLAGAMIHRSLLAKEITYTGISPEAHVGEDCLFPDEVIVAPKCVIGDRVKLGERVILHPGVVLADDVSIGADTVLHANVTIGHACRIGDRVIIHSGTVIGSDGFGYASDEKGNHYKRPHVGIVQIDEDVEIASNVSIDRGTFGKTWIKKGTKIDNLVHIAHNVVVGENCLLAGQVGIAGSTVLGDSVAFGGQVGVKDHVRIGDQVMAVGKSGILQDIESGSIVAGYPAIPQKHWLKVSAVVRKLPALAKDIKRLEKELAELKKVLDLDQSLEV